MPRDLELGRLGDGSTLCTIWKKLVRPSFRKSRLTQALLLQDPLTWAHLEWSLTEVVETLAADLKAGRYRASYPTVIRSSKGLGLTRPLAFLSFEDTIVYRTLVALAENQMIQGMPEWARMGRRDPRNPDDIFLDSGWFRGWLRRQGQLWVMAGSCAWLVETDVSNYFPSIDGHVAVDQVRTRSDLPDDACRVLEHLLASFAPDVEYRGSPVTGLPQEPSDASRLLAHAVATPVDLEFRAEGDAGRYSRWVDDLVIGADSREEAEEIVGRVQLSMEKLGLYPNRSKTRIYRSSDFELDYMKEENDYLGEVHDRIARGLPVSAVRFRRQLKIHLAVSRRERRLAWDRVLRRYYTEAKRIGDDLLLSWWDRHLIEEPTSAAHVLDYMATYRLTKKRIEQLQNVLKRSPHAYEDVRILSMEYLSQAPNVQSRATLDAAADLAVEVFEAEWAQGRYPVAASAAVVIGKLGEPRHMDCLESSVVAQYGASNPATLQAIIVLLGCGRLGVDDLERIGLSSEGTNVRAIRYLGALVRGDKKATGIAYGLLTPVKRTHPDRPFVRPRSLFLAPIVRRNAPTKKRRLLDGWATSIAGCEPRFRDRAAELWLLRPPTS